MKFHFIKYHGAGNDFILFDDRKKTFPIIPHTIVDLCHRQYGIGADGLILLHESKIGDASFQIFNSDGREAVMCGNGLRCLVHFFCHITKKKKECQIFSKNRLHRCKVIGNKVVATLGPPKKAQWDCKISIKQEPFSYCYVDTGVPHFVHFTSDLMAPSFMEKAKYIRFHSHFNPDGVNVNFATLQIENHIAMRTYERGVEAETLACGTGAAAVALSAWKTYSIASPIQVKCTSGEILQFDLFEENDILREIEMTGPVSPIFKGTIEV